MGIMDRIKEEANSAISATMDTTPKQAKPAQQQAPQFAHHDAYGGVNNPAIVMQAPRIPHYVVLQVTLKEKFIGTGSGNLSELEKVINDQASRGYRLHTISTASGGSVGLVGGDRIQATMVFEQII